MAASTEEWVRYIAVRSGENPGTVTEWGIEIVVLTRLLNLGIQNIRKIIIASPVN